MPKEGKAIRNNKEYKQYYLDVTEVKTQMRPLETHPGPEGFSFCSCASKLKHTPALHPTQRDGETQGISDIFVWCLVTLIGANSS